MTANRVIGVDLGGTKILAGVIDEDGTVTRTVEEPTPTSSQADLLDGLESAVRELLTPDVAAVGFGVPSRIDHRTGVALGAVNIPIREVDFRGAMEERLGLPIGADNDANVAALAEFTHGAGRGCTNMVMLTLGTGVGGGVVIDRKLYRGWAELGHMVIVEDGEPCQGACTGRGHVESYCTGVAAGRLARRVLGPDAKAHDLIAQKHHALDEIGHHLGTAIGSLVNIFNPDVVVIGGGVIAAGELLLAPARAEAARRGLPTMSAHARIVPAQFGTEAGLVGAAALAFEGLRDAVH